jgi:hypothetical protein
MRNCKPNCAKAKNTIFQFTRRSSPRQNQRREADRAGLPASGGAPPGNGGGREVGERREEVEGDQFLSSPRAETPELGPGADAGAMEGPGASASQTGRTGGAPRGAAGAGFFRRLVR